MASSSVADDTAASVIPLIPLKKREKRTTRRAKTTRQRKRKAKVDVPADAEDEYPASATALPSEFLIPPEFLSAEHAVSEPPLPESLVTPSPSAETNDASETAKETIKPTTPSRRSLAAILLSISAVALAAVGITINGWFARSLGSSDVAGWLFLAVGVAADLVALVMPSCAAALWQTSQRATALVGWSIWLMTFVFAVTAGIGFASTNISDVTTARASRVTPAITNAQGALTDAMAARDRECKSGVGKFCREREAVVAERRQVLDQAQASVGQTADPQSAAAIKLVIWASGGMLRPTADDFAMLRLVLLALLPQIGGILLLVGRHSARK
jgi:hypothetical protein